MKRREFYKEVSDDWYPNWKITTENYPEKFHGDVVKVSVFPLQSSTNLWRICVWGADDMGMELDSENRNVVEAFYILIANQEGPISAEWLSSLGFVRA